MTRADSPAANPHWLPRQAPGALDHIPGERGWPVIGNTLKLIANPAAYGYAMVAKYGTMYRHNSFGSVNVSMLGPDANELVLFDRDKVFSSEQGWGPLLNQLFPRGLMLMDFDGHRADRRTLSVAFKPEPMRHYFDALDAGIAARVADWSGTSFAFYPAIKALTLDLAAASFLGVPLGPVSAKINRAFVDMVQASIAPIRVPLPGTAMGRGVAGRKFLVEYFGREVPRRRASGTGDDMFSQICRAADDDGGLLSVEAIVDHMNFLMMAAHDTITSSATSLAMLLGRNPEWQQRLRAEMLGLGIDDLTYDRLGALELTEWAFKEALRIMPPVPSLPRRALRPFSFRGHDFPAGTQVGISPAFVHKMPEHWPDPQAFDPLRFSPEGSRGRHKYAWVPFGGGAHMCLGLHFAYLQIKLLMWHLLREHRIDLPAGSGDKWQAWPIPKPRDGLPVTLTRL